MSSQKAHIYVEPDTRDRLRAAKSGGESYDDVVNRLLDKAGEPSRQASEPAGGYS